MVYNVELANGLTIVCNSESSGRLVKVMVDIDTKQGMYTVPYWSVVWKDWVQAIGKSESRLYKSSVFEILFTGSDLAFVMVDTKTWQVFIACVIELIYFERITGILGFLEEKDAGIEEVLLDKLDAWMKIAKEAYEAMKIKAAANLKNIQSQNETVIGLQNTIALLQAQQKNLNNTLDESDRRFEAIRGEYDMYQQRVAILEKQIEEQNSQFTSILNRIDLKPKITFISFIIRLLENLAQTFRPLETVLLGVPYVDIENKKILETAVDFFKKFLAKLVAGEDKRARVLQGVVNHQVSVEEAIVVLETLTNDFSALEADGKQYFQLLEKSTFGFNEKLLGLETKIQTLEANLRKMESTRVEEEVESKSRLEESLRERFIEVDILTREREKLQEALRERFDITNNLTREKESLQETFRGKLIELNNLMRDKETLIAEQRKGQNSVSRLESELSASRAEFEKLKNDLQDGKTALSQQAIAFQSLTMENTRLREEGMSLKNELIAAENLKELTARKYQKDLAEKTNALLKSTNDLNMAHSSMLAKDAEIKTLKESKKQLDKNILALQQEAQTTTLMRTGVEDKRKELEQKIIRLERENDDKKRDYEGGLGALTKKLEETSIAYEKVKAELHILETAVNSKEILNAQKDVDAKTSLTNKTKEYGELEVKFNKVVLEHEALKKTHSRIVNTANSTSARLKEEIEKLKTTSADLEKKNSDLTEKMNTAFLKSIALENTIKVQENVVRDMQNRIETLSSNTRELESRIQAQALALRNQTTELETLRRALAEKTNELSAAVLNRDRLLIELGDAKEKIESIRKENTETASKLEKDMHEKTESLVLMKTELETKLRTKIKDLKEIMTAQKSEISNLLARVEELRSKVVEEREKAAANIEKANQAYNSLVEKVKSKNFFSDAGYVLFDDFKNEIDKVFGLFFKRLGADVSSSGDITSYLEILGTHITAQNTYLTKYADEMNSLKTEIKKNQGIIAELMLNKERETSILETLQNDIQELRMERTQQDKNIIELKETIAQQKDYITQQQTDLANNQNSTAEYAANLEQEARSFVEGHTELLKKEANAVLNLQTQRINELEARLQMAENLAAEYAAREDALLKIEVVQTQKMRSLTFTMNAKADACMQVLRTVNQKSVDLSQTLNLSRVQAPRSLNKERTFEQILAADDELSVISPIQQEVEIPKKAEPPKELDKTLVDIKPAIEEIKGIATDLTEKVKEVFAAQPDETQKVIQETIHRIEAQTPTADLPPQIPLTEAEAELSKSEKELAKAIEAADVTQAAITNEINTLRVEREHILSVQPIMQIPPTPVGVDPSVAKSVQSNIIAKANALPKYEKKTHSSFQTLRGSTAAFFDSMNTQEIAEFGLAAMRIAASRSDAGKFMGRGREVGFDPNDTTMQEEESRDREYYGRYDSNMVRRYGGANAVY
jgi:hypothetical protein